MIKKILKVILEIIILIVVYLLQIYLMNNTTFFGVKGDLCLMLIAIITLLGNNYKSYTYALFLGIISDILFSSIIGKYTMIYVIVVSILIGLKKMYKQDSKISIIIFATLALVISEVIKYLFSIATGNFVNIFSVAMLILKESIINIFLAFILYLIYSKVITNKE